MKINKEANQTQLRVPFALLPPPTATRTFFVVY